MRGSSVPGNQLEVHLRMFTAVLREAGYRDRTICSKLRPLADLGHWLKRTGQSFASRLEEHLLEAKELIPAREVFDVAIALVAIDANLKLVGGEKIHELGKNRSSKIHLLPPEQAGTQ